MGDNYDSRPIHRLYNNNVVEYDELAEKIISFSITILDCKALATPPIWKT